MDWEALAQAVIDRRVELGFRTREAFAEHTGLSSRLLGDLEHHRRTNYDRVTFARLEQALEWPAGRARQILRAKPTPPIASFVERLAAPPSDDELLGTLRHFLADLPGEYRQQLRDYLQRGTEWAMWAQQNAEAMREVAEVAGWDAQPGQVTSDPSGRQSVR